MDNQHRQIKGYRELTQAEIDLMNDVKSQGVLLGELCARVAALAPRAAEAADLERLGLAPASEHNRRTVVVTREGLPLEAEGAVWTDPRWTAIAQTHLQQGLMALTRAVARPSFF